MMRLAPGGPFDQERPIPPEILRNIERAYHLDEPLWQQYPATWAACCAAISGRPTGPRTSPSTELLAKGAPASFKVGGLAVAAGDPVGHAAGIVAALRQNSWVDYSVMSLAMVGIAIPSFVMAPLLDPALRGLSRLAAGRRLGRRRAAVPDPAGGVAGAAAGGAGRPARARRHDRAAACELRPHRAGQGPARAAGPAATCAAGGDVAGGLLSGADDGSPADGLGGHRDYFQPFPGIGRYFVQSGPEPRLHRRDGRGDRLRRHDHPAQSRSSTCSTASSTPR